MDDPNTASQDAERSFLARKARWAKAMLYGDEAERATVGKELFDELVVDIQSGRRYYRTESPSDTEAGAEQPQQGSG